MHSRASDHHSIEQRGRFGRTRRAPKSYRERIATCLSPQSRPAQALVTDVGAMPLTQLTTKVQTQAAGSALGGEKWFKQMALD